MDEMDEDEDIKISVDNIPFIAEESFLIKYGKNYTLKFDKNKQVVLTATDLQ